MIHVRKSEDRGHFNRGWLESYHTFSFGEYNDPDHVQFKTLRVMNEDWVQPGKGFGMHPHKNMEIITYILSGSLEHKDSMGNGEVLSAGELQRMTAGSGIYHSEFNPSETEATHLYQIWIYPEKPGLTPGYEQKAFSVEGRQGKLQLVASSEEEGDALKIHQDARLYLSQLDSGGELTHSVESGRSLWVQVLKGAVSVNGQEAFAGDGVTLENENQLEVIAQQASELLVFDLA